MPVEAILWDSDGVLVDTEELFFQANHEVFVRHGLTLDHETFAEYSLRRGQSVLELIGDLDRATHDALRAMRNQIYERRLREGVRVFDGVEDCLAKLHGQLPMAIVTSAFRDHFEIIHTQTKLLRFFEFALKGGDYERHKPHPEPYLLAASRLGIEPSNCLVVEDSERGLEAATRAGMRCVVIPNRLSPNANFLDAHTILPSVHTLPEIVTALNTQPC